MRFYMEFPISENVGETPEGFLACVNVPISRVGELVYGAEEIPDVAPDADGLIIIERVEDEVFAPVAMASFEGKPVTLGHPDAEVTPENWSALARGVVKDVRRQGDLLVADLLITDQEAIEAVRSGALREVSCGYDAEYEDLGNGRGIQRAIVGNHVALVDKGRCGWRCAIRDNRPDRRSNRRQDMGLKDRLERLRKSLKTVDQSLEEISEAAEPEKQVVEVQVTSSQPDPAPETPAPGMNVEDVAEMIRAIEARVARLEESLTPAEATAEEPAVFADEEPEEEEKKQTADAAGTWQDTAWRASILVPGIRPPIRKASSLTEYKREVLHAFSITKDGARQIAEYIGSRPVKSLDEAAVEAAFAGISDARARGNNKAPGRYADARRGGPANPAEINRRNQEFWTKGR